MKSKTTTRRIRSILKAWNQDFPNRKFAGLSAKQFEEIFLNNQDGSQSLAYFPSPSFAARKAS